MPKSSLLFFIFLILVTAASAGTITELTAVQFQKKVQAGEYDIIIDVRTQAEWDVGHIAGATLVIDLAQGGGREAPIASCKDSCKIAIYCRSGSRARAAATYLNTVGFTGPIDNGQGVNQWTAAGFALVRTPSATQPCITDSNHCKNNAVKPLGVCFASDAQAQVLVKDRPTSAANTDGVVATRKMKDLRVGDYVLVNFEGQYEPIYDFGHYDPTAKASYLKFSPSGLKLSKDHMVFLHGNPVPVPASQVKLGDVLRVMDHHGQGEAAAVTSIATIFQEGAYAPFTPSGTIVVNGVQASTFISFQDSATLMIGQTDTGLTYQWMARTFELPHKWFRFKDAAATSGRMLHAHPSSEAGISSWVSGPHAFVQWWLNQYEPVLFMVAIPIVTVLFVLATVEWIMMHCEMILIVGAMTMVGIHRYKQMSTSHKSKSL